MGRVLEAVRRRCRRDRRPSLLAFQAAYRVHQRDPAPDGSAALSPVGGKLRLVTSPLPRRFLKPEDAAEIFSISQAQMYALLRRGDIRAIKLGGRGQWRVEASEIESYIERAYAETKAWVEAHPFAEPQASADEKEPGE